MSDLGEYILEKYYKPWSSYRQQHFEAKWSRNLASYRNQDSSFSSAESKENFFNDTRIDPNNWRSNSFIGLTRTKTMAGIALVADNILQDGDLPFTMAFSEEESLQNRYAEEDELLEETEQILAINSKIKEALRKTNSSTELTEGISNGGLYGDFVMRMVVDSDMNPGIQSISNWNIIRDYSTADLQEGLGIIQRSFLSTYLVTKFVEEQGDIVDIAIAKEAVTVGSNNNTFVSSMTASDSDDNSSELGADIHELLECFVTVPTHLLYEDEEEDPFAWTKIVCYILNGMSIGFSELDHRFFYLVPWQRDIDNVANIGIPDNTEDMQRTMNTAFRGFEDNKYLAGNVWGAYVPEALEDQDSLNIFNRPGEFIKLSDTTENASQAIQQIVISDVGQSYISLIELADRFSDEHSMIPKIAYGSGSSTEKTAYQTSQEIDKAGKYVSSVIRNIDEMCIEPFITDVYDFFLSMETEGFDANLSCKALGYSTYNDRVVRAQKFENFMQLIFQNEQFAQEFNIKRIATAIGDTMGMDIVKLLKTRGEIEEERELAQEEQERLAESEEIANDLQGIATEKEEALVTQIETETAISLRDIAIKEKELELDAAKIEIEVMKIEQAPKNQA